MGHEDRDYLAIYDLEEYLLGTVRDRFQRDRQLNAFDFFCIVIWKANRAKSKVAERMLSHGHQSLDAAVADLTNRIAVASDARERLRVLVVEWGFRVPMASAVLTVLYPDEFTICDIRVAEAIGAKVPEMYGNFETLWGRYQEFRTQVAGAAPEGLSLRDKDRYLWGRSFYKQLSADIRAWRTRCSTVRSRTRFLSGSVNSEGRTTR